ncbi:hypothetical protein IL992_11225 [Microbispora sp. NEAU-D428]|uniref:hypothetical protein n=1 Tax=Microbispora sitophila TaxID=2771537 RepID=UPI0018689DC0|nr:hypothetical protein [Microbispora sitophila]MBE3009758.1 hypothetical protein [Microbispora sitophila]
MIRFIAPLLAALSVTAAAQPPASGPAASELKAALIGSKAGYAKVHTVAARASRFASGGTAVADWAFSALPARCRTAATTGLLWDPKVVARFPKSPAAVVEFSGRHALGESLISVPESLPDSLFHVRVPRGCASVRVAYQGRRVKVKIAPLTSAELPDIPGASVSGVKTTLPPGLWGHDKGAQKVLIVVRDGNLVLETYADAFGPVGDVSRDWTTASWARAMARLT